MQNPKQISMGRETQVHNFSLLQCAARWLCEAAVWHNSRVSHKAEWERRPLVVFAPAQWGGSWEGRGGNISASSWRQLVLTTVITAIDWAGSQVLGGTRLLMGQHHNRANGWTSPTPGCSLKWFWPGASLWKTLALAAPERQALLCGSIGPGGFLKAAAGWEVWIEV